MSVEIIDKIKPKNNGDFPLVDAADVEMPDGKRLSEYEFIDDALLSKAVNEALAQAKESGVFDGKDGKDGKDGADGKTPVKGQDYYTDEEKLAIVNEIMVEAAKLLPLLISEADNGKIMQVVDGVWAKVEVKDSSIATYVDEYISSALEGDY